MITPIRYGEMAGIIFFNLCYGGSYGNARELERF